MLYIASIQFTPWNNHRKPSNFYKLISLLSITKTIERKKLKNDVRNVKFTDLLWLLVRPWLLVSPISRKAPIVHVRVLGRRRISICLVSLCKTIVSTTVPLGLIRLIKAKPKLMGTINIHTYKRHALKTKNTEILADDHITCLFEGLRPHDSLMLCPPNWVPFKTDSACSAQVLKYITWKIKSSRKQTVRMIYQTKIVHCLPVSKLNKPAALARWYFHMN